MYLVDHSPCRVHSVLHLSVRPGHHHILTFCRFPEIIIKYSFNWRTLFFLWRASTISVWEKHVKVTWILFCGEFDRRELHPLKNTTETLMQAKFNQVSSISAAHNLSLGVKGLQHGMVDKNTQQIIIILWWQRKSPKQISVGCYLS